MLLEWLSFLIKLNSFFNFYFLLPLLKKRKLSNILLLNIQNWTILLKFLTKHFLKSPWFLNMLSFLNIFLVYICLCLILNISNGNVSKVPKTLISNLFILRELLYFALHVNNLSLNYFVYNVLAVSIAALSVNPS